MKTAFTGIFFPTGLIFADRCRRISVVGLPFQRPITLRHQNEKHDVGQPEHQHELAQQREIVAERRQFVADAQCLPSKIAAAQRHIVAGYEGVLSLTLAFNGDPVNTAALDNVAFEVRDKFQARKSRSLARRHQLRELRRQAASIWIAGRSEMVHNRPKSIK